MDTNNTFGERLKSLRRQTGKSQVEVATELAEMFPDIRMSQTTLSALEQRATAPRGEVLECLARYYNVPLKYFFEEENSADESRLAAARAYLEKLRSVSMTNAPNFAHNSEHRRENDEIG